MILLKGNFISVINYMVSLKNQNGKQKNRWQWKLRLDFQSKETLRHVKSQHLDITCSKGEIMITIVPHVRQ